MQDTQYESRHRSDGGHIPLPSKMFITHSSSAPVGSLDLPAIAAAESSSYTNLDGTNVIYSSHIKLTRKPNQNDIDYTLNNKSPDFRILNEIQYDHKDKIPDMSDGKYNNLPAEQSSRNKNPNSLRKGNLRMSNIDSWRFSSQSNPRRTDDPSLLLLDTKFHGSPIKSQTDAGHRNTRATKSEVPDKDDSEDELQNNLPLGWNWAMWWTYEGISGKGD